MRLLMIDDDDFKIERIQNELQKIKTIITLDVVKYRNKGLRMLYENGKTDNDYRNGLLGFGIILK